MTTKNVKTDLLIPERDPHYIEWGNYDLIEKIIGSGKFFPVWITGHTGNGKTQMVEQVCAKLGRELVRLNMTPETDQDDLLGGFRLSNGSTEFVRGPVTVAMEKGAVLLLDEVDAAHSGRILALQAVLEGKPILLKATGDYIVPKEGFTVIATSNTKGRGSETGHYVGTNIMNAAFLDRFAATVEQEYPPEKIESEILQKYFISYKWKGVTKNHDKKEIHAAATYIQRLIEWAQEIRKSFDNESIDDVISTRSLVNIIKGYSIVEDEITPIKLAVSRYDKQTADAMYSYYEKMNPSAKLTD